MRIAKNDIPVRTDVPGADARQQTNFGDSRLHRTARCVCAAASITVAGDPKIHVVCHCADCKRRTGSAFGTSAYFPRSAVVARAGETRVYAFHHVAQDHDQERYFCASCGTTLFWCISSMPELIGIAAGCFADHELGEPRTSVSHARKLPWVDLPERWKRVHA